MNKRRIVFRFIASPFVFGILAIAYAHALIKHFFAFLIYGGEWITYAKDEPNTIKNIYTELKEGKKNSRSRLDGKEYKQYPNS